MQYTDQAFPFLAGQRSSSAYAPAPAPPAKQQQQQAAEDGWYAEEPKQARAPAQAPKAAPPPRQAPKTTPEHGHQMHGSSANGGAGGEGDYARHRADSGHHMNGAGAPVGPHPTSAVIQSKGCVHKYYQGSVPQGLSLWG